MTLIGHADRTFLFLNIAMLMCIAFLPFPTKLVADHLRDDGARAATIAYGLTMTAASICFAVFWFYAAIGRRSIAETTDQSLVSRLSRRTLPGLAHATETGRGTETPPRCLPLAPRTTTAVHPTHGDREPRARPHRRLGAGHRGGRAR
jgi:hypothetical protein